MPGAIARATSTLVISSFFEKESFFYSIALFFVIFSCEGSSWESPIICQTYNICKERFAIIIVFYIIKE